MVKAWKARVVLILGGLLLTCIAFCIWGCQQPEQNEAFFAGSSFAEMNEIFEDWCAADPNGVVVWTVIVNTKEE